jgi:hypothetical protein
MRDLGTSRSLYGMFDVFDCSDDGPPAPALIKTVAAWILDGMEPSEKSGVDFVILVIPRDKDNLRFGYTQN